MNQRYIHILLLGILLCAFTPMTALRAYADSSPGFGVKAILPDNQINSDATYFDLQLAPGDEQTIQLLVSNNSDEAVLIRTALHPASTAQSALIIYQETAAQDAGMRYSVNDAAAVLTEETELASGDSAYIDIAITMPEDGFDGVILGGLVVSSEPVNTDKTTAEEESDDTEDSAPGSIQIENRFTYTVGLVLRQNDHEVPPALHLLSIQPDLVNYQPAVTATIQNSEALIMKEINFTGEIREKNSDTAFCHASISDGEMAPESSFDFVFSLDNEPVRPGTYIMKMTAGYEEYIWEWEEEFTITASDAAEVNDHALDTKTAIPLWAYIIAGLLLLIIVAALAYYLGRTSE